MSRQVRVGVVDDHAVVRMGVKLLVGSVKDFVFAGGCASGAAAAAFVREAKCDIVLLDIRMPDRDGVTVLGDLLAAYPELKVVMLTTSGTEEDVYRSMTQGAKGYVLKSGNPEDVLAALRTVAAGGVYMPEGVREVLEARAHEPELTAREREVLVAMAEGRSNSEVAKHLGLSVDAVKGHLKRIYGKFGVTDRLSAVRIAVRRGYAR